jgi:hypothetical protein
MVDDRRLLDFQPWHFEVHTCNEQVEFEGRSKPAFPPMIDLVDIKRDIDTLGDRLGKTQDYL